MLYLILLVFALISSNKTNATSGFCHAVANVLSCQMEGGACSVYEEYDRSVWSQIIVPSREDFEKVFLKLCERRETDINSMCSSETVQKFHNFHDCLKSTMIWEFKCEYTAPIGAAIKDCSKKHLPENWKTDSCQNAIYGLIDDYSTEVKKTFSLE